MKKIQAIVRRCKLLEVHGELVELGLTNVTISQVAGFHATFDQQRRGRPVSKILLEVVVSDDQVDATVATIAASARTDNPGDGNIFVSPVEQAVRILTGEHGPEAIWDGRSGQLRVPVAGAPCSCVATSGYKYLP